MIVCATEALTTASYIWSFGVDFFGAALTGGSPPASKDNSTNSSTRPRVRPGIPTSTGSAFAARSPDAESYAARRTRCRAIGTSAVHGHTARTSRPHAAGRPAAEID